MKKQHIAFIMAICCAPLLHAGWLSSDTQPTDTQPTEQTSGSNVDLTIDGNVKFNFSNKGEDVAKILLVVLCKICGIKDLNLHNDRGNGSNDEVAPQ